MNTDKNQYRIDKDKSNPIKPLQLSRHTLTTPSEPKGLSVHSRLSGH